MQRVPSSRGVARQSRDAVEIAIMTGELGQTMGLHDRYEQGVIAEQADLLTKSSRGDDQWRENGQDPQIAGGEVYDGLPKPGKPLDLARVLFPVDRIQRAMINQRIGINENGIARLEIRKGHGS